MEERGTRPWPVLLLLLVFFLQERSLGLRLCLRLHARARGKGFGRPRRHHALAHQQASRLDLTDCTSQGGEGGSIPSGSHVVDHRSALRMAAPRRWNCLAESRLQRLSWCTHRRLTGRIIARATSTWRRLCACRRRAAFRPDDSSTNRECAAVLTAPRLTLRRHARTLRRHVRTLRRHVLLFAVQPASNLAGVIRIEITSVVVLSFLIVPAAIVESHSAPDPSRRESD